MAPESCSCCLDLCRDAFHRRTPTDNCVSGHEAQAGGARKPRRNLRSLRDEHQPGYSLNVRPRPEWGTIPWAPTTYGRSVLGIPLEVWRPAGDCHLLIHAGIHGEEPETTYALSRALRQMVKPPEHCAVVLAANPDGITRGTRGNARGVDLNRNFPSKDWRPGTVTHRSTIEDKSDILLSTGRHPHRSRKSPPCCRSLRSSSQGRSRADERRGGKEAKPTSTAS